MIILTGEHKEKYLATLKTAYENNKKIIESNENNEDKSIRLNEITLQGIKVNNERLKERYETFKNQEGDIEIFTEGFNDEWFGFIALAMLFSNSFNVTSPNDLKE